MLTYARGKMPGCFADITGFTAHTYKLINHWRTKPTRDRVFHAKHAAYLKGGKNWFDILLVGYQTSFFSSFKIGSMFGMKDPIPGGLRSRVVYKFVCAGCKAVMSAKQPGIFSHANVST